MENGPPIVMQLVLAHSLPTLKHPLFGYTHTEGAPPGVFACPPWWPSILFKWISELNVQVDVATRDNPQVDLN